MDVNMHHQDSQYAIFASDLSQEQTETRLRRLGIGFKTLRGAYKGVPEVSYITSLTNMFAMIPLIENQESVLLLSRMQDNGERNASLLFKDGKEKKLGMFMEVTKEKAEQSESYTEDSGKFYVAG